MAASTEEECLRYLQSLCSPSACEELTLNLQKENLLGTLNKCCIECNALKGSEIQEYVSSLILHIVKEVQQQQFYKVHDDENEYKSVGSSLGEVEPLMTLCAVILSCLVKTSGCSQEGLVTQKYVMKKVAVEVFILCASHIEKWPWTSTRTRTTAKDILDLLCNGCKAESFSVLLSGSEVMKNSEETPLFSQGLLPSVLGIIYSRMNAWPPLTQVVCWCAMQIQYPNVGKQFPRLLPSTLKLIEDHQVINKAIGVKCLHHIIKNMNSAELIWYGRIDVIYEVLQRLLYLNEPLLLDKLYPCMLHVLQVIKSQSGTTVKQVKESDSFMQIILTSMEYESNLQLRRVHAAHLEKVVEHMQINLLRYFKRFLSVVLSYLAVHDDSKQDIQINVLQALQTAILHVWPRISGHADVIVEALLKLVVDCFDSSTECKEPLLSSCKKCLTVLYCCCPRHMKKALHAIREDVCHPQLQEYVSAVIQDNHDITLVYQ